MMQEPAEYQSLIMAATRYYLAETSFEVRVHVGWLTIHWPEVKRRDLILADIAVVLASGRPRGATTTPPAWPEYADLWQGFLRLAWADLDDHHRERVFRWVGSSSAAAKLLAGFGSGDPGRRVSDNRAYGY